MDRGKKVTGVRMRRVKLDGRGRQAKLKAVRNSEYTLPCDMVIKALGQEPLHDLLQAIPETEAGQGWADRDRPGQRSDFGAEALCGRGIVARTPSRRWSTRWSRARLRLGALTRRCGPESATVGSV